MQLKVHILSVYAFSGNLIGGQISSQLKFDFVYSDRPADCREME